MASLRRPLLLSEMLPALVRELQGLLAESGEAELVAQVPELEIVERCRCGDDFCATFYAQPKPDGKWGPNHRSVALEPTRGMLILDVVDGKIACVEVLYRDSIRKTLHEALP
ncbi:MAG: hypothetical protein WA871_11670 [Candidatus Acidiferrales bacterium]